VELQRPISVARERAIEHQRVKVHVEPEISAKSLHRRHRAAARAAHALTTQEAPHAAKHLAQEHPQHIAQQRRIARAQKAHPER
jgi:hypothetical protein